MASKMATSASVNLKGKWADWTDDELSESEASTAPFEGAESADSSSDDDSSPAVATPKLPPGQFGCVESSPMGSPMVMGSQQVFLMPVMMNGMQVFMPMVAAQSVAAAPAVEEDGRTTLMLRNLPKSFTRTDLLRILDEEGFQGSYCFIYVPTDFKRFAGFGYAFVAFHCHSEAVRAKAHFQGYSWGAECEQSCDVAWSGPVQGREQHVERYRNSPVMHESVPDEYKPAVFEHGQRIPFPAPTKAIRPPRLRHGIAGAVLSGAGES
jgi:hypothetical protein